MQWLFVWLLYPCMELGLRNKLFGLLLVLHSSSLAGAGSMRAPVHAASLARHKQKEISFLENLAERLILHLWNLARLTNQAKVASHEMGNQTLKGGIIGPVLHVDT